MSMHIVCHCDYVIVIVMSIGIVFVNFVPIFCNPAAVSQY